jgi:hypothetical protein
LSATNISAVEMKFYVACLAMLLCWRTPVLAQYAADQPKSLAGVESVFVVFGSGVSGNSDLFNSVTLELRKTGLRIVSDSSDVILNVSSTANANALSIDVRTRLDIEQVVLVPRTQERLQLVTWYYENEERISNVNWSQEALKRKVMTGVNQFLNDFLAANGR